MLPAHTRVHEEHCYPHVRRLPLPTITVMKVTVESKINSPLFLAKRAHHAPLVHFQPAK